MLTDATQHLLYDGGGDVIDRSAKVFCICDADADADSDTDADADDADKRLTEGSEGRGRVTVGRYLIDGFVQ